MLHREIIQIPSADGHTLLEAFVYVPTTNPPGPSPVVVAGHGLTLTKDAGLQAFAERWAEDAGYASVLFDYRHFGGSGGTPRDKVSLNAQYEDYRSVINWIRQQPERFLGDHVVVMGSAAGGLSVSRLAVQDTKLAGAMMHCPVLDGYATLMAMPANPRLLFWASVDWCGSMLGLPTVFIPAVGKSNEFAFLNTPTSFGGFNSMFAQSSVPYEQRPNRINASVVYQMMSARYGLELSEAKCPVLIVMPETDDIIAPKVTREVIARAGDKVESVVVPGGHYDVMKGGVGFAPNIAAQVAFLKRVM